MIILGVALIFCSILAGCKGKSDEERIGELLGKLEKAEKAGSEKEAQRINKEIEELTETQKRREKEGIREVEAEIGKPLRWRKDYETSSGEIPQFSVTFEQLFVSKRVPWAETLGETEDKKYLIVYARIENLGSREASPPSFHGRRPEVKVANGFVYDAYVSAYKKMGYSVPTMLDSKGWDLIDLTDPLKAGEKVWWTIFSEIPKEAIPVEFFGEIYNGDRGIKFRLKLKQISGQSSTKAEETETSPKTEVQSKSVYDILAEEKRKQRDYLAK